MIPWRDWLKLTPIEMDNASVFLHPEQYRAALLRMAHAFSCKEKQIPVLHLLLSGQHSIADESVIRWVAPTARLLRDCGATATWFDPDFDRAEISDRLCIRRHDLERSWSQFPALMMPHSGPAPEHRVFLTQFDKSIKKPERDRLRISIGDELFPPFDPSPAYPRLTRVSLDPRIQLFLNSLTRPGDIHEPSFFGQHTLGSADSRYWANRTLRDWISMFKDFYHAQCDHP